eukprot:9264966-Alexandrium_andersonii.AAC.1
MAPVARSARTIQPRCPAYSILPHRWAEVAVVDATSRPNKCQRPTTPTGGASTYGVSLSLWPPQRGSLRTTRHTVGSRHGSCCASPEPCVLGLPTQRAQPTGETPAGGAADAARPP